MSDDDVPEEAVTQVRDAIETGIEPPRDMSRPIPEPSRKLGIA